MNGVVLMIVSVMGCVRSRFQNDDKVVHLYGWLPNGGGSLFKDLDGFFLIIRLREDLRATCIVIPLAISL